MKTAAVLSLPLALRQTSVHVSAARTVALAYLAATLVLFIFVLKNASPIPIHDELCNIPFLVDHPPIADYWRQHNEHRIPLPRLLYVAAFWMFGGEFRGPQYFNALMLTAAVGVVLLALWRSRGRWEYTDALVPLALLTTGQYGNLLWGFQVQFIASTSLVLLAIALMIAPGLMLSRLRLLGLGVCGTLLPLCGANGLAFVPGICGVLLFAGAWNLWGRERNWTVGLVGLFCGLLPIGVLAAYFWGLNESPHHNVGAGTTAQAVVGAVNLLGATFGPIARHLPPRPYEGITLFGALGVLLVLLTAFQLFAALRDSDKRPQAIAFAGVLLGFLALAGGISKSRSGFCNVLDVNRYYTLMLPMVVGAYAAWTALGSRWMPRVLLGLVVAGAIPNAVIGYREGREMVWWAQTVNRELRDRMPLEFIADRHRGLFPAEPEIRRAMLLHMASNGIKPFNAASPIPSLREERVPLDVLRVEQGIFEGGTFRATGEIGQVVFALPKCPSIYGVRLRYEARAGANPILPNVISWGKSGGIPTSHIEGVVNQLEAVGRESETLFYLNCAAETFRIDLWGQGACIRIQSIDLLMRVE